VLGEAYLAKRDPVAAMRWFDRAIAEMPDSRAFRFLLNRVAWLYATLPDDRVRNGAKAVTLAERAVRLSEGSILLCSDVGAAYRSGAVRRRARRHATMTLRAQGRKSSLRHPSASWGCMRNAGRCATAADRRPNPRDGDTAARLRFADELQLRSIGSARTR
jgi:hypothetical protein